MTHTDLAVAVTYILRRAVVHKNIALHTSKQNAIMKHNFSSSLGIVFVIKEKLKYALAKEIPLPLLF